MTSTKGEIRTGEETRRMPWSVRAACVIADAYCAAMALVVVWLATVNRNAEWLWILFPLLLMFGGCAELHHGRAWTRRFFALLGALGVLAVAVAGKAALAWTLPPIVLPSLLYLPSSRSWWFPEGERAGLSRIVWMGLPVVAILMPVLYDMYWGCSMGHGIASSAAMVARGRQFFLQMVANPETWHENGDAANSTDFVKRLLKAEAARSGDPADTTAASLALAASLLNGECEWCIAVDVPEDADDAIPVMFSANLDPADIPLQWDYASGQVQLPLNGRKLSKCGNMVVVIRKGGSAQVIKPKYLTPRIFYNAPTGRVSRSVTYLTPDGRAALGSRR